MVCAACGTENPEAARFCYKCGTAMTSQPAATRSAPPQTPPPPPGRPAARAKGGLNLVGGLLIAGVLLVLVLLVGLNALGAVARIINNLMIGQGWVGIVIGLIYILVVIAIATVVISWLIRPLRGK